MKIENNGNPTRIDTPFSNGGEPDKKVTSHRRRMILGGVVATATAAAIVVAAVFGGRETDTVSEPDGYANGMGYVDLGLSVKWASCNLGASRPEEYGHYYAWAETEPRTGDSWNYDWNTTPHVLSGDSWEDVTWSKYTGSDGKTVLDPEDDAATVALGSPWRIPTIDEVNELLNKCKWTRYTYNGVEGYMATGPNGNSIFLPATGWRYKSNTLNAGVYGICWSSSLYTDDPRNAYGLSFYSGGSSWNFDSRHYGLSVRAVCL